LIAVGDPDHVAEILQQLASFGVEQVLCLMNFGGMPFRLVLESLTLTAQEVLPRLASAKSNAEGDSRLTNRRAT